MPIFNTMIERTPQCLLGHGDCAGTSCGLHEHARTITNAAGDDFDGEASRQMILFGDVGHEVNVFDITRVRFSCAKECEAVRLQGEQSKS